MSNHTPGPWFIWQERALLDEGNSMRSITESLIWDGHDHSIMAGEPIGEVRRGSIRGCVTLCTIDPDDYEVKEGDEEFEYRERALADARLIAAAPALLEELRLILEWANTERAPLRDQEINRIGLVIAKATGKCS